MIDHIDEYLSDAGFDLPQLINDDFFLAIKLLFNHGYFVSCAKLIVSFLDTVAFVEYGDVPGNFIKWLDTYVDLEPLGVTSQEMWEYRNSLVHMTTLESRRVTRGEIKGLIPVVVGGGFPLKLSDVSTGDENTKHLDLFKLLTAISAGACDKWPRSLNADPEQWALFFERYSMVISDKRVGLVFADTQRP